MRHRTHRDRVSRSRTARPRPAYCHNCGACYRRRYRHALCWCGEDLRWQPPPSARGHASRRILAIPPDPRRCQSCGHDCDLTRWLEHDERDQPTAVVVVLCRPCSDRIIEPHPRLYAALDEYAPHSGSMALCRECSRRSGVSCTHPDLKANGGAGLNITMRRPDTAFVSGRGAGGRRTGWVHRIYHAPPSACAGRAAPGIDDLELLEDR